MIKKIREFKLRPYRRPVIGPVTVTNPGLRMVEMGVVQKPYMNAPGRGVPNILMRGSAGGC